MEIIGGVQIAFIVGLLLTLTKVADFLFLEKQKDAIEKYFARFYNFIKELNPSKWLSFLQNDNLRFILATIGCLLLAGFIFYKFWNEIKEIWSLIIEIKFARYFIWVAILYGVRFVKSILGEYIWDDVPDWLIDSNNAYIFILKYITIVSVYIVYNLVVLAIVYLFIDKVELPVIVTTIILTGLTILNSLTLIFSLYILWLIVIFFPIFLVSVFLVITSILLRIIRFISVRIMAYNKGVFAGLVLVATTILGIISLVLKQ